MLRGTTTNFKTLNQVREVSLFRVLEQNEGNVCRRGPCLYTVRDEWLWCYFGLISLCSLQPDDLSTVHLSTIPQKDRTYAMLSKKKKRRSNNKKPKHPPGPHSSSQSSTEWPSVDALTPKLASHAISREGSLPKVATRSSSVDMPTPEYAVHSFKKLEKHGWSVSGKTTDVTCMRSVMEGHTPNRGVQLNSTLADTRSLPVEEIVPNRAEPKGSQFGLSHSSKRSFNDTAQHRNRNVLGHNDDGVMSPGVYERSEAESSGYQSASSLSAASSDSEYSDSEAGQMARLRWGWYKWKLL